MIQLIKYMLILCNVTLISIMTSNSQDIGRVNLTEGSYLISTQELDSGVAFILSNKNNFEVVKYNTNLNKKWSVEAPKEDRPGLYSSGESLLEVVSSPSNKNIYIIDIPYKVYQSKTQSISKIDGNGDVRNFKLEGKDEFGKDVQTIFCNGQSLFYLTTENGDQRHDRKKRKEKIILNAFDCTSTKLGYSRKILDLPVIEGESEIFWEFIGNNESEFFMASKEIHQKENFTNINIIAFNYDGSKRREINLEVKLKKGFIRPARLNATKNQKYADNTNLDYLVNTQSGAVHATNSGFTGVHYSSDNFYLYGLQGPKAYKKFAPKNTGFYVFKFDNNGKKLWQKEFINNKQLLDNKHFHVHAMPGFRALDFNVLPNGTINFSITITERLKFSKLKSIISDDGEKCTFEFIENTEERKDVYILSYLDESKNYGKQFIKTTDIEIGKNDFFQNIITKNLEILYQYQIKPRSRSLSNIFLLKE